MSGSESISPVFDDVDRYLFAEGTHKTLYKNLGSHRITLNGEEGTHFCVWAPNASSCAVIGDFNHWNDQSHVMHQHVESGLWQLFIPKVEAGAHYKYALRDHAGQQLPHKSDPFAKYHESPPGNASIVCESDYSWSDEHWMQSHEVSSRLDKPISIYEVHLPSWRRHDDGSSYSFRECVEHLIPYVRDNGFTHLELLPVSEHPFEGSWGYQPIGMFAPTHRLGTPDDFRYFIDSCHQAGLAVIMDWVPAHFPSDEHGLVYFDGTSLYEHQDPRQGFHREWNTCIFNYGRKEVKNYLLSNALFWIDEFHLDGLRVDAVASMLYLNYARDDGDWVPNQFGGHENLEAVEFLKDLNQWVESIGGVTFAEESTSWEGVTKTVDLGGLGFRYKWNMGWMNDVLDYFSEDPLYRKFHHSRLTFGQTYAFTENFVLPFSHDEMVYGKKSLLEKMPGDQWQKYANLRLLYMFLFAQPGKKLLFMGGEIAQSAEWNHDAQLDWNLLGFDENRQILQLYRELNELYRNERALHIGDCHELGFQWIDCDDNEQSVISFYRRVPNSSEAIICIFNFTPVVRQNYSLGVYDPGKYTEIMNSDAVCYGGSGVVRENSLCDEECSSSYYISTSQAVQGKPNSITLTLPPLAALFLRCDIGDLSISA